MKPGKPAEQMRAANDHKAREMFEREVRRPSWAWQHPAKPVPEESE